MPPTMVALIAGGRESIGQGRTRGDKIESRRVELGRSISGDLCCEHAAIRSQHAAPMTRLAGHGDPAKRDRAATSRQAASDTTLEMASSRTAANLYDLPQVAGSPEADELARIETVTVETGGHQYPCRPEALDLGPQHGVERVSVGVATRTRGERNVDGVPSATTVADLVEAAGARVPRVLVQRHEQHLVAVVEASWVPLPWWASKSTIATRSPAATRAAAVTLMLLSRQKPIDVDGVAWCPGGRTTHSAALCVPARRCSIATRPAPAARRAASNECLFIEVSPSMNPPPNSSSAASRSTMDASCTRKMSAARQAETRQLDGLIEARRIPAARARKPGRTLWVANLLSCCPHRAWCYHITARLALTDSGSPVKGARIARAYSSLVAASMSSMSGPRNIARAGGDSQSGTRSAHPTHAFRASAWSAALNHSARDNDFLLRGTHRPRHWSSRSGYSVSRRCIGCSMTYAICRQRPTTTGAVAAAHR